MEQQLRMVGNGISCLGTHAVTPDMFEVWEYLWCHYGNLYLSLSGCIL